MKIRVTTTRSMPATDVPRYCRALNAAGIRINMMELIRKGRWVDTTAFDGEQVETVYELVQESDK